MIEAVRVSWLTAYIRSLVLGDLRLSNIWVEGEVSSLSRSQRGHTYFTLKDGDSQIRCVMFQRSSRGAAIENGAQVLAHGSVDFWEGRGEIQFIVDFVQPAGIGARQAEFERLKEKLGAEGLFDETRKRKLPPYPTRIGVVTSPAGAVLHDICHVLERRWPLAEVVLAPTPVQGAEAPAGVAAAIGQLNREPGIDVIIVARGGGSMEELWTFNEEIVARAIFASSVPVVSAIGHETDFTIADFVADVRAPTPSAAAETVAPDRQEVARRLQGLAAAMTRALSSRVSQRLHEVDRCLHRLRLSLPDTGRQMERVANQVRHARNALERRLEQRRERAASLASQLRSLDPRATLARGYAVVQLREGKMAITSVRQVKGKDRLDVHVRDGRFPAEVSRQYGF